jgi:hypothetical protein
MPDETTHDDFAEQQPQQDATQDVGSANDGEAALADAGKQAIDRMKAERNAANSALKAAQRELERLKQAQMSESERSVAEAETRGRQSALAEMGEELARARFDALAGRRNPAVKTDDVLEFVDLSRFLTEDGRPDDKALSAAVDRLVAAPQNGPPSFDGGARRTAPKSPDMDALIRGQVGARTQ